LTPCAHTPLLFRFAYFRLFGLPFALTFTPKVHIASNVSPRAFFLPSPRFCVLSSRPDIVRNTGSLKSLHLVLLVEVGGPIDKNFSTNHLGFSFPPFSPRFFSFHRGLVFGCFRSFSIRPSCLLNMTSLLPGSGKGLFLFFST